MRKWITPSNIFNLDPCLQIFTDTQESRPKKQASNANNRPNPKEKKINGIRKENLEINSPHQGLRYNPLNKKPRGRRGEREKEKEDEGEEEEEEQKQELEGKRIS